MDIDVQPNISVLSAQVPLYVNPEPLDAERHAKLGIKHSERPFGFAAKQNFAPLHLTEFSMASQNYPIVFAGPARTPLAVMGINPDENLFITADGVFRRGAYVPAFIRRYPFLLARHEKLDEMAVCIDRACALFTEDNPDTLLLEDGQPSAYTKNSIDFCQRFEIEELKTQAFAKALEDLGLFERQQIHSKLRQPDGTESESRLIAEYFAVSEAKLNALPLKKLGALRDGGMLSHIYIHLVSLLGWDRLILEAAERHSGAQHANVSDQTLG